MLPAVSHLEADRAPRLAALWNTDRSALVALGAFNADAPSWRHPYARLIAVKSKHSFQSGVLLRTGIDAQAVDRFIGGLFAASWRAVRFDDLREDSLVHRHLQEAAQRLGLRWFTDARYERAGVRLGGDANWHGHISGSRHRRLQRARAKLAELGKVEARVVQGADVSDSNVDAFLRLEAMGWKRASALLSTDAEARFFREVARACRERGLVFFCELLLDGNVIASTSNFTLNGLGFAFKIGTDPTYARFGPGYLVEYAFLESAMRACPHLREMESGSQAGSFIEELWPERIAMVSGYLVAGKLPATYEMIKQRVKSARRSARHMLTSS
jgi:hypothetical protein